jgi:hypothetical protein
LARHFLNSFGELSDTLPAYGAQDPVGPNVCERHYAIALSGPAQVLQLFNDAGNLAWSMTCTPRAYQVDVPRVDIVMDDISRTYPERNIPDGKAIRILREAYRAGRLQAWRWQVDYCTLCPEGRSYFVDDGIGLTYLDPLTQVTACGFFMGLNYGYDLDGQDLSTGEWTISRQLGQPNCISRLKDGPMELLQGIGVYWEGLELFVSMQEAFAAYRPIALSPDRTWAVFFENAYQTPIDSYEQFSNAEMSQPSLMLVDIPGRKVWTWVLSELNGWDTCIDSSGALITATWTLNAAKSVLVGEYMNGGKVSQYRLPKDLNKGLNVRKNKLAKQISDLRPPLERKQRVDLERCKASEENFSEWKRPSGKSDHSERDDLLTYAEQGDFAKVKSLVEMGVAITQTVSATNNIDALILATSNGSYEIVEYLLKMGVKADPVSKDSSYSALRTAALNGDIKITKLLLENGANPNLENAQGLTALELAESHGYFDIVDLLKAHGGEKRAKTEGGNAD